MSKPAFEGHRIYVATHAQKSLYVTCVAHAHFQRISFFVLEKWPVAA